MLAQCNAFDMLYHLLELSVIEVCVIMQCPFSIVPIDVTLCANLLDGDLERLSADLPHDRSTASRRTCIPLVAVDHDSTTSLPGIIAQLSKLW